MNTALRYFIQFKEYGDEIIIALHKIKINIRKYQIVFTSYTILIL